MPPKARILHDISCIIVDVGGAMEGEVEEAKNTADWILSRKVGQKRDQWSTLEVYFVKIFTNSKDEVRLIVTGSEEKSGDIDRPQVIVHGDEFLTLVVAFRLFSKWFI